MKKLIKIKKNRGMSYVELIVVLSIFSVMTSVVMFNYGDFQAKVDIKNLASDIALKIVEAQKSSLSGKLPTSPPAGWKPAYGVYFTVSPSTSFIYFADLNNDKMYNETSLDTISITKNNVIDKIEKCNGSTCSAINNPLALTFQRPDSRANFDGASITGSEYVQITIKSPKLNTATIKVYPSGRIQIN